MFLFIVFYEIKNQNEKKMKNIKDFLLYSNFKIQAIFKTKQNKWPFFGPKISL
jgi:hypothetical protein